MPLETSDLLHIKDTVRKTRFYAKTLTGSEGRATYKREISPHKMLV